MTSWRIGRVGEVNNPAPPFISSPLGLVPKHDGGFRKIHHLSYPSGDSVNDYVADEASSLSYTFLPQESIPLKALFGVFLLQWLLGSVITERLYTERSYRQQLPWKTNM